MKEGSLTSSPFSPSPQVLDIAGFSGEHPGEHGELVSFFRLLATRLLSCYSPLVVPRGILRGGILGAFGMGLDISLTRCQSTCVYDTNITHNLAVMAREAQLYYPLWRPEEIGLTKAGELIPFLRAGLKLLRDKPAEMEKHSPPNGWGRYIDFVPFVERYLRACEEYPDADIRVDR